jgi:hypothetical protein
MKNSHCKGTGGYLEGILASNTGRVFAGICFTESKNEDGGELRKRRERQISNL